MSRTMKAVDIRQFVNSIHDLAVTDVPLPTPKEGEVVVRVKAAGVNYVDALYARGKHQNNRRHVKPPFILGLEFAGIIVAVHASVAKQSSGPLRIGSPVFGAHVGSYAQHIAVPADDCHPIPPGWSPVAAAGLAATLPVAYGALVVRGRLQPADSVLVLGAAGGLGCMAVQVAARVAGCRQVIAVASSEAKCQVAQRCGATMCINTSDSATQSWWDAVLSATDGRGVDVILDTVGSVNESLKCVADRGRVLVVGFAARDESTLEKVATNRILLKQASIIGYRYGESLRRYPEENRQIFTALQPLLRNGLIQPVVYEEPFRGLESVPRALQAIADRKVWGKAVIRIADEDEDKARL